MYKKYLSVNSFQTFLWLNIFSRKFGECVGYFVGKYFLQLVHQEEERSSFVR